MNADPLNPLMTPIYYEAHVTVEPCFGERLEALNKLVAHSGFRVANLVMLGKNYPNQKDSFISGRDPTAEMMTVRVFDLVKRLVLEGFQVYRFKIEATLFDTKRHEKEPKDVQETKTTKPPTVRTMPDRFIEPPPDRHDPNERFQGEFGDQADVPF